MDMTFDEMAKFCEETYGSEIETKNDTIIGFICPECNEFIYSDDWSAEETKNWTVCPICETNLIDT